MVSGVFPAEIQDPASCGAGITAAGPLPNHTGFPSPGYDRIFSCVTLIAQAETESQNVFEALSCALLFSGTDRSPECLYRLEKVS